mmetsp:Transcript_4711/g.10267  ORF Transcript_4711/g.10267 Transcript_4711/m.10267 type:complete len:385 (-) Transcript_4711:181-1335(-)
MQGDLRTAFATPPSTPPVTIAPAGTKLLPGGHKTCGEDSYAKLTRSIESLKIYLEAVYRDPAVHHLSNERLDAAVRNLAWLYHGPVSLAKVSCTTNVYNWRPDMCNCDGRARDGLMVGQFHPPMLTLRFNRAGVWLPHGMAHRQAAATTFFVADETYMEVQRIGNAITEHGVAGCWFLATKGSGVYLSTGRSLRVMNRTDLAERLGLFNRTDVQVRRKCSGRKMRTPVMNTSLIMNQTTFRGKIALNPWYLEDYVDLCPELQQLGYDTVQIFDEECHHIRSATACIVEVVSCHNACQVLPYRRPRKTACVPDLPLRTGWNAQLECKCHDEQHGGEIFLNCLGTEPSLPSPIVPDAIAASLSRNLSLLTCGRCAHMSHHVRRDAR